jgi:hypothetical protein
MANAKNPLERLRHHVSGAIARGEAEAITEVREVKCDCGEWGPCSPGGVTHIDEKGYAYCTAHGAVRRQSGIRCRKMRGWEVRLLQAGKPLPSYEPRPMPIEAA